jgi:hypothetical protein
VPAAETRPRAADNPARRYGRDMSRASTRRRVAGSSTTRHDARLRARLGDRGESCIAALASRRAELSRDLGGRHVLPGCRGVSPCPAPLLAGFNGDDPAADIDEQRVPRSRTGPAFKFCDECPKPRQPLTLHHCEGPSPPPRTPLSESFPTSRDANTVVADHQGSGSSSHRPRLLRALPRGDRAARASASRSSSRRTRPSLG